MPTLSQGTINIFSGENIATTGYSYATANPQNVIGKGSEVTLGTTGWQSGKYNNLTFQFGVATLTRSGNVQFRVEGRTKLNGTRPASIYVQTLTAITPLDYVYNLTTPKLAQVRVGVRTSIGPASPLASPCNIYCTLLQNEDR